MTAPVVNSRGGWNEVRDVDLGMDAAEKRFRSAAYWLKAGLWTWQKNRWSERLATIAWTHNAPNGSSPNWIGEAKVQADASVQVLAADLQAACILGTPSPSSVIDRMGQAAADAMRATVRRVGLVETGDLAESIGFQSATHAPPQSMAQTRTRTPRSAAKTSARQQLYQLYHKGHSGSMRAMRRAMSYRDFERKYAAAWMFSSSAHRRAVISDMRSHRAKASAAARSAVPGRINTSQAQMIRNGILRGNILAGQFDKLNARIGKESSRAAARAARTEQRLRARKARGDARRAARAAAKAENAAYAAAIRSSLSHRRRGRR